MEKTITFIPIDYDYFDFNNQNYAKIIGRTKEGERACIIDSCPIYIWAILKPNLLDKQVKKLQNKIETIEIKGKSRISKVLKTELHDKRFLGKDVRAIKIFITNYKDAHEIADKLNSKLIYKRREYDLGFITKYIIERKINPLEWYEVTGEVLNNSSEFGNLDSVLDVDICIKSEKIIPSKENSKFSPKILAYDIETDEFEIGKGNITMISLYGKDFKKVLTWKKSSKKSYVENFKDEEEMLEKFLE